MCCFYFKAAFTSATPASDSEYFASNEGFHTVTVCVKSHVDRTTVALSHLFEDRKTCGRQHDHIVVCELPKGLMVVM